MNSLEQPLIAKVTAFVTRRRGPTVELLVFKHPTAGVQLPAGTIDAGETPFSAVVREVYEETGLTSLSSVTSVGLIPTVGSATDRMVVDTTPLYRDPSFDSDTRPIPIGTGVMVQHLRRGYWVEIRGEAGPWANVRYTFWSIIDGVESSTHFDGWVPSEFLVSDVRRELFHVTVKETPADRWTHSCPGDGITGYDVYWTSLADPDELVESNRMWLASAYDNLLELIHAEAPDAS